MSTDIDVRSKKRAMAVFVGCCVMQAFGLGTVLNSSSAFFAVVPGSVGLGMGEFAMWLTCYGIAALFGTFFAGILIPKFGAKIVISVDVVISAVCVACFAFATQAWQFSAIGIVLGLTGGMFFLYATPLLMGAWFGKKHLGRYLGIAQLMSGIGGAIFPLVFTSLFGVIGYQGVYLLNAALIACILIFSLTVFCENPAKIGLHAYGAEEDDVESGEAVKAPGVPLRYALPTLAFVLLFLGCMLSAFPGSYNSFVQANAIEVLGPDFVVFSAMLMTALQIGYIIASFAGGILIDKIGVKWVTAILYVILIICYICFSFLNTPEGLLVCAFFFGMNNAIVTISVPMLAREHFGMKAYDKILSYCMMGVGLCGSMGAPVIGFIFDSTKTYNGSFLVGAVIAAIALVVILLSFGPAKKVREAHWVDE